MTAQQFVDALNAEGATVKEVKGWRTNNRAGHGAWGPLNGVIIHHTAGGSDGAVEYCFSGSSDLPGPLAQVVSTKDGTLHMIGNGRANHAGGGDPDVLDAVIAERQPVPKTGEHQGSAGAVDGNAHFYGVEAVNHGDGNDPWPDVQMDALVRFAAAICRFHGWSANSVIGHKEWSDWKSDPSFDMNDFRARVQVQLDGHGTTPPKPEPAQPTVSLAALIDAARRDVPAPTGSTSHKADVLLFEKALVKLGYLDSQWADGSFGTKTKEATSRLQRYLGYTGDDADGVPGNHSLTWVSLKTGLFKAVA
jgi:hypothetical protein